ncbi:MAG: hypothetical protein ACYCST_18565 [Acidimicrobiales bacterium]
MARSNREEHAVAAESNGSGRRRPRVLSAETKWEIFLQFTAGSYATCWDST